MKERREGERKKQSDGGREGGRERGKDGEKEGGNEKSNQEIYLEKRSRREETDRETAG